jgi:hypothetical protein
MLIAINAKASRMLFHYGKTMLINIMMTASSEKGFNPFDFANKY